MTREQRLVFGEVAELYDRARPSYPAALVDAVLELAGAGPDAEALDVGCGTGKAAVLFAERGLAGVGVEPDSAMAAVATRNLATFPKWSVVVSDLERWDRRGQTFDLVIAAQSWHWLRGEERFRIAHSALRPGGWLALWWNVVSGSDEELRPRLDDVYRRHAPALADRWLGRKARLPEIADVPEDTPFGEPVVRSFPWSASYTTQEYLELQQTHSDHRMLAAECLARLLVDVAAVVDEAGGVIVVPYKALLWAAPRH